MATRQELEGLAERIMLVSVRAEFLGLRGVVDAMDLAFSDVVRIAAAEKLREDAAAREVAGVTGQGGVDGG